MPGCVAVGCTNSAKKGFLMKRFPSDPIRRRDWAIRTERGNWTPTDSSVLCEAHFEPEMWELTRQDGSRRLRCNAVPTIFSFTEMKQIKKLPNKRDVLSDVSKSIINDAVTSTSKDTMQDELVDQPTASTEVVEIDHSYANSEPLPNDTSTLQSSLEPPEVLTSTSSDENPTSIFHIPTMEERLLSYQNQIKKKNVLLQKYKTKLKFATTKLKSLEKKFKAIENTTTCTNEEATILRKLFKKDQIIALKKRNRNKSTKFMAWSNETIMIGMHLRSRCGISGYDELLKLNLPFPSVRTLQRKIKSAKI